MCLLFRVSLPAQLLPLWPLDYLILTSLPSPSFPLVIQNVQMFRFAHHPLTPSWIPRPWDWLRDIPCWDQGCEPSDEAMSPKTLSTQIVLDTVWEPLVFPSLIIGSWQIQCPTCASHGIWQWCVPDFWCHGDCPTIWPFPPAVAGNILLGISFCSLALCCPLLGLRSQSPLPCSTLELFCALSANYPPSPLPTFISFLFPFSKQ